MYSVRQLRRAVKNPVLVLRELNRQYHRLGGLHDFNIHGIDIMNEDWDILVILDACRLDMYEEVTGESVNSKISRGSSTVEFLHANFEDRDMLDTVYVTANPQLCRNRGNINSKFHDVINVWMDDGWDEEYSTVLPKTTTNYGIDAARDYPNKRLIIHYLQPHYPFLTKNTTYDKGFINQNNDSGEDFWTRQLEGKINLSSEEIWKPYKETLKLAISEVNRLLNNVDGKAVITADHGNMVGERSYPIPIREWGHPDGLYVDPLVKVPWHIIENGNRRDIVSEEPNQNQDISVSSDMIMDRLSDLGYVN